MTPRLSRTTLPGATLARAGLPGHADVRGPAVDPGATSVGLVHLGLGAFHRAHPGGLHRGRRRGREARPEGILGVTRSAARVADRGTPGRPLRRPDEGHRRDLAPDHRVARDVSFPGTGTAHVVRTIAAPTTLHRHADRDEKGYRRAADGRPILQTRTWGPTSPLSPPRLGVRTRSALRARRSACCSAGSRAGTGTTPDRSPSCAATTSRAGPVVEGLVQAVGRPGADALAAWVAPP